MKKKNTLIKIITVFTAFAIGASLLSNHFVQYKELDATQHASNFNYYVYSGNYYSNHKIDFNASQGMNGALRTKLTSEIVPASFPTYSGSGTNTISDLFQDSEQDPTVSSNMIYFYTRDSVTKTAGTVNGNVIWNREHVWPKSLSNDNWKANTSGATHDAGTDLLHLRPTYPSVNSSRGNTKYGQAGSNPDTKVYNGITWGYIGNDCFEPIDANKGDVARIIMYVWTAYTGYSGYNPLSITDVFDSFDTLLTWHTQDKPDVLEGHRNDVSEASLQKNRNPFVDHPELAWKIFGDQVSQSVRSDCETTYPSSGYNPGQGDVIPATSITVSPSTVKLLPNEQRQLTATVTPTNCTETVSWTSSNTSIATVSDGGKVTVKPTAQAGQTVNITATVGSYSDTCVVTIKSASADQNGYILYQDAITEGDYIIHYDGKSMEATVSSSRLGYIADTPADDTFPADTDASVIWHIAPSGNYWTIYNEDANKYAASNGTKNQAALVASADSDKALWTITESDGTFEIVNKNNAAAGVNANLRNNGTYGFACYSNSTGGPLSLYKKAEAVVPPEPTAADEVNAIPTRTILSYSCDKVEGTAVTDTLNNTVTGVTGTSYVDWSGKVGNSGAVYAGQCAGANSSIQLRSKNSNSGVITTTSGGNVSKVTVTWESHTQSGRQLDVYGKNTAYSSPTDLYDDNSGTLLGSIVCGTSTSLTITGSYQYIGLRSNADAMYLSSIDIKWGEPTTYTYSNVMIRFRGLITTELWDQLDDEATITGYGVMLSTKNYLNGAKLQDKYNAVDGTNVKDFLSSNLVPTLMDAATYDSVSEDHYVWNLRKNITTENLKTVFVAVAYIVTRDSGVVFFDEVEASAKSVAQDMIDSPEYDETSYSGSLYNLATLA